MKVVFNGNTLPRYQIEVSVNDKRSRSLLPETTLPLNTTSGDIYLCAITPCKKPFTGNSLDYPNDIGILFALYIRASLFFSKIILRTSFMAFIEVTGYHFPSSLAITVALLLWSTKLKANTIFDWVEKFNIKATVMRVEVCDSTLLCLAQGVPKSHR